ncbi:MAG: uroporphyrinogen-III synthase, partial [Chloroflexi bacterium]|nr:uroporphyrinogen-III synthase [Chloroflexota bacterium]
GLRVAAFESRRATEVERMLTRAGAHAFVSPSMREIPLEGDQQVLRYARQVIAGEFDVVVLMTGVGLRLLVGAIEGSIGSEPFLRALASSITIARGPKPTAVLKDWGLQPTHQVPEPNTWREILALIDAQVPVSEVAVAVQEYGVPNHDLVAGLEARGATVTPAPIYRWGFPEDVAPLEANVRRVAAGDIDLVLFTSSQQVVHVLATADRLGLGAEVRRALGHTVIASIGPTTSATLRKEGLAVEIEPEHPKMGHLIRVAAEQAPALVRRKREC